MSVFEFEGRIPVIDPSAYISESATVIGKVTIGKEVWVGPGAVLRGDYGEIIVGSYTAIEENCVIHARPGETTRIGEHVTLGHGSIVHTGNISDWAVIGMAAVVSDFARVGTWAAVGEGAVVKSKSELPDETVSVGIPAKVVGNVSGEYKELWEKYKKNYNTFCQRYRNLRKIS
jgi:carbonic anhydrase/acetyltransferase-like protein (isoleucine patch superfamily)